MKARPYKKYIPVVIIFILGLLFVAKFAGGSILRLYVETGMGNCQKIPILCLMPQETIREPAIDKEYLFSLKRYAFTDIEVYLPAEFQVVKERTTKAYYKKRCPYKKEAVAYIFYGESNFFLRLFPEMKKYGLQDDYDFLQRTMEAKLKEIKNIQDAFFVIMKGLFTPNLGEETSLKMIKFTSGKKKGFINYTLGLGGNYFDCNILDERNNYFKLYIKDHHAVLDLGKVFTIISALKILQANLDFSGNLS